MPRISIITPVYRVEKYIHRCIDSILNQTFTDFELILVDDGSPDRCGAICDEYAAKDSRIAVLHQENAGQAAARNRALDIARGEYIAFVDSDDWIHPQYLQCLLDNLRACGASISACGHTKVTAYHGFAPLTGQAPNRWEGAEYVRQCMTGRGPNKAWLLWDKLFHRDCFANVRMPVGRINEDNAIVYKILYEADVVAECDEILYYYFQNEASTVNQSFKPKHLDWLLVPQEMIAYFTQKQDPVMIDKANRMYLSELVEMYGKVRDHLNDPRLLAELKAKIRTQYRREKKRYPINVCTHPSLYAILFPTYTRCYWTLRGIRHKLIKR